MSYFTPLFPLLVFLSLYAVWRQLVRAPGPKPRLLAAAVIGIFLVSWPPVSWLASRTLEAWYPARVFPAGEAKAIVVLSGLVLPPSLDRPRAIVGYPTFVRCEYAAWLYRNWRPLPILASGGTRTSKKPPSSVLMRQALEQQGVPPSMISTEERSRSTAENARYAAEILRARGVRRIALVTEAYHMLRAEKCFRRQGIDVVPAPCGFTFFDASLGGFLPRPASITTNAQVLHEWLGLAWYFLCGRI